MGMIDPEPAATQEPVAESDQDGEGAYLYGIGLASSVAEQERLDAILDENEIRTVRHGDLVAFVRSVPLAEFSEQSIQERLQDQEWLMHAVQHHHQVIADLSAQLTLLPSTFGAVYESEDAVSDSLEANQGPLTDRLREVSGCDEWALHLFRDEAGVRERVLEADPELQRMSRELESAPTGRAYLLRQQLEKRLSQAIEEQQLAVADAVLEQVEQYTRGIQVEEPRTGGDSESDDVEIARASLLVPGEQSESMLDALDAAAESTPGIRVEVSGPWPVYSFANTETEDRE